jgi:hypothetical protein
MRPKIQHFFVSIALPRLREISLDVNRVSEVEKKSLSLSAANPGQNN